MIFLYGVLKFCFVWFVICMSVFFENIFFFVFKIVICKFIIVMFCFKIVVVINNGIFFFLNVVIFFFFIGFFVCIFLILLCNDFNNEFIFFIYCIWGMNKKIGYFLFKYIFNYCSKI